ncbi:polyubiquitin-like [Embiotoca jacksoni]|uniref:polyubiquitin-like n=1 Tax=Embiotoca jacksoni TaxID=100190 RepID=UPI003703FC3D
MDLIITMLNGKQQSLRVQPQDTVASLKTRIQDALGVPTYRQKLVFDNGQRTTLSDESKPICSYGLQSGSRVSLLVTEPATIQVFLKKIDGKISTYDIKPEMTVDDFKTKVQHREGVQVSQQRLIHNSRDMMTGTLADYDVKEHSTIHMTARLRGG